MDLNLCTHLDEYGVLYVKAEAAYNQCLNLLDRVLADGPGDGLLDLLSEAVATWKNETIELRETFADLVEDGVVGLPQKNIKAPTCLQCQCRIPRLEFPEWTMAANGVTMYRGNDLPQPETMATS